MAIVRLTPDDTALFDGLLTLFGAAFEDAPTSADARPGEAYRRDLLGDRTFIALAAVREDVLHFDIGGRLGRGAVATVGLEAAKPLKKVPYERDMGWKPYLYISTVF